MKQRKLALIPPSLPTKTFAKNGRPDLARGSDGLESGQTTLSGLGTGVTNGEALAHRVQRSESAKQY